MAEDVCGAAGRGDTEPARVAAGELTGSLLRRIRRTGDLSQRELADGLGIDRAVVARAETGQRALAVGLLVRAAELAGLRLALLDATGSEVPGMSPDAVRDRSGRLFPAHLDVRYGDEGWWHGEERYSRRRPWYTFDRRRDWRDHFRSAAGAPPDHQPPRPGDSPEERAAARQQASLARWRAANEQHAAQCLHRSPPAREEPTCSCPPACDDLLFADEPLSPRLRAEPHVDDCPCRCDIA